MQSKVTFLTPAAAVNVHEMVLRMGLSICMVTCEEVNLCVCVLEIDEERGSEFRGAKRKRCLACWMPIRSWRPICSMSFPRHSWILFFSIWQDTQPKGCSICTPLSDRHKNHSTAIASAQKASNICRFFFCCCWTVIVTTHATTISDALMVIFSPNVLLLCCLNKWVNATSLKDTLSAWMSYWNVHLNNKWPFNSLVSLDLSKESTVNYSKQGAAAIECHGA